MLMQKQTHQKKLISLYETILISWNGNRVQIKRVQFEHFIDGLEAI